MFNMCEWKKQLENAVMTHYTDPKNICGNDLEELYKWIDVIKDVAEAEYYETEKLKNLSIIEAMEKAEVPVSPETIADPLAAPVLAGYNNRRYASGRYAPAGRGTIYGYPMMYDKMDINPVDIRGYEPYKMMETGEMYTGRMGYRDANHTSRYGRSYDKYTEARKFYTETKDPEHKQQMNDAVGNVVEDVKDMLRDMWRDMDPEQKTKRKNELINEISNMH